MRQQKKGNEDQTLVTTELTCFMFHCLFEKLIKCLRSPQNDLFFKSTSAVLYGVSRLMLPPIVTRSAAQQQHRVCLVGGLGCVPTNYQVTPN